MLLAWLACFCEDILRCYLAIMQSWMWLLMWRLILRAYGDCEATLLSRVSQGSQPTSCLHSLLEETKIDILSRLIPAYQCDSEVSTL